MSGATRTNKGLLASKSAALPSRAQLHRAAKAAPAPHRDAGLLNLGALLDAAYAREKAAWEKVRRNAADNSPARKLVDKYTEETGAIVDRIAQATAVTMDGLLVKMRAINWCRAENPISAEDLCDRFPLSTDMCVLAGLVRDLAAIEKGGADHSRLGKHARRSASV